MNRIFPEQLTHSLNTLAPVYLLTGSDPLLLGESEDAIFQAAKAQGFDERQRLQIDSATDWDALLENAQAMGLFFEKQCLSLSLPETLSAPLQKNLLALIHALHADLLLILQLPKFAKATEKAAWFSALPAQAVIVNCQTPTSVNLPRWVSNRCKAMGLHADNDAVQLLAFSYENNLLALKQTLQLLDLLHSDRKLTAQRVQAVVEQSSIFTPFQWIDALLLGKTARAKRILAGLRAEDVQPIILLRTLQRELQTLLELCKPQTRIQLSDKLPTAQLRAEFDRLKIWQNRRALYLSAIQRFTYQQLFEFIQNLAQLERLAKQEFSDEIWGELEDLAIKMTL